ncbi:MAG: LicD family protein [Lachnospiraceae bacterium]|nr:LicD family protein [Lachnospiraceae bacterium]
MDKKFFEEETRWDYLITKKQKKIWALELEILEFLDEICKKHGLRYYLEHGTLLGAARHQGFIPWDDDLDVGMPRPDYEKLKVIMETEIREPFFFQTAYTDSLMFPFAKIRNTNTTAIEEVYCTEDAPHQGIYIDIFPLDGVFLEENAPYERMEREIWMTISSPEVVIEAMEKNTPFFLPYDMLISLLEKPIRDRFRQFEALLVSSYDKATEIGLILPAIYGMNRKYSKSWYEKTVELPFEHLRIPAPAEYTKVLELLYGDYMTPVQGASAHNEIFMDPDRSYLEYYRERGLV